MAISVITRSRHAALLLLATVACTDVTGPFVDNAAPTFDVAAQAPGNVYVMLQTDPDGTAGTFSFDHDFGASSSPEVPTPFTLGDGQLEIFNSVAPGSYTTTVTVPPTWDLVASGDGYDTGCWDDQGNSSIDLSSGASSIDVASSETVICTFVLRKRATLSLDKRENGALPLSQAWAFELRTGASVNAVGTARAAGTASMTSGQVSFACSGGTNPDCAEADDVVWLRAGEYQLCEVGMPAGASNNLDGFAPAGAASEGNSNATECVNVTLGAGASATTLSVLGVDFIDNTLGSGGGDHPPPPPPPPPPPGSATPRSIAEWRNHESCSTPTTARKGLGPMSSGGIALYLPSHPTVFPLGLITAMDCDQASRILSRQDFDATNRASDAAYTLAAQLLAARLNMAAGAPVPECVATVMSDAQNLLGSTPDGVGFTGNGEYLGPKSSKSLRASAIALADVLGRYNSGEADVLANNCG